MPFASAADCQLCFLDVHNSTGSVDIGRDKRLVPDMICIHIRWKQDSIRIEEVHGFLSFPVT